MSGPGSSGPAADAERIEMLTARVTRLERQLDARGEKIRELREELRGVHHANTVGSATPSTLSPTPAGVIRRIATTVRRPRAVIGSVIRQGRAAYRRVLRGIGRR